MSPQEKQALARALAPITSRVRTDVTAVKANGRQAWTDEPLTEARLMRHVNGAGPARGCCPIKEGESVTLVGLFDLDSHKGEIDWPAMAEWAERISASAEMFGLNAIPFRSSGGNGIHLIFLWDDPQDAHSVRQTLRSVLASVGLADGTGGLVKGEVEVFPRQDRVPMGGKGNQFVLPLAGASEPLLPMLGYEPVGKDYVVGMAWPVSEPVVRVEAPVRAERGAGGALATTGEGAEALATLRSALAAIPNDGEQELGYDQWRNIIFGIHAETGGSDDGLALAHEFSMRSGKYDPEFLDNRVWPYVRDREGGVSGRTILAMAREHGWQEDIGHMFEPLAPVVVSGGVVGGGGEGLDEDLPAFSRNKNGEILTTLENVGKAMRVFKMAGMRIAFDEFYGGVMFCEKWDGSDGWRPISDADIVRLRVNLERWGFSKGCGKEISRDCVGEMADSNRFDSAILWARQLKWDGVPRVAKFFAKYFSTEDDEYAQAVSLYTWTALAGRCLVPGIKADMSPVLIGAQGARKSSGVAAMSPKPNQFIEMDLGAKDEENARLLRGVLVAEFGELKGMYSRQQEHVKAFMSRRVETWIPKYIEYKCDYHRRAVFIGTSNQSEFLVDETGNRRWLPLLCGVVDTAAIERDRDQLWAEAIVLFEENGVMWQDAETLGKDKHSAHMVHDEWEHIIENWLSEEDDGVRRDSRPFRLAEVISGALGIFVANIERKTEIRAGKVLKKLGYEKRQTWTNGKNVKLWHKKGET